MRDIVNLRRDRGQEPEFRIAEKYPRRCDIDRSDPGRKAKNGFCGENAFNGETDFYFLARPTVCRMMTSKGVPGPKLPETPIASNSFTS